MNTIPNVMPNVLNNVFNNVDPRVFGRLGPELMLDWDMSAVGVAAWTGGRSAVLTKETDGETGQALRSAYGGTSDPRFLQPGVCAPGVKHMVTGIVRSDGVAVPRINDPSTLALLWVGTNSASWQEFEIPYTTVSVNSPLYYTDTNIAGYCEWDNISVKEIL